MNIYLTAIRTNGLSCSTVRNSWGSAMRWAAEMVDPSEPHPVTLVTASAGTSLQTYDGRQLLRLADFALESACDNAASEDSELAILDSDYFTALGRL